MKVRKSGFSLIELIVVLTIVSIVIAAVSMRWTSTFDKVAFETNVQRIVNFDNQTRRHAIEHGRPCQLKFDLQKNRIGATRWNEDQPFEITHTLDEKVKLKRVNTVFTKANPQSWAIDVTPHGTSLSYYLEIQCGKQTRWIVIAGGSGQSNDYDNEADVSKVFAAFALQGINAD